ncbi:anti-sigma factor domain-containing protein [Marinobacter sp. F3R08]|uniref:anti-sigma factor n=1 Tax=Marinobacter sp. F3R08 TaxID=2841559 RepID=UPI001C098BF1|nr:anti-sigma factor [Marinobacter sp. F3R08]MBU2954252.1 anti-sigma factor [Marinobacter sp. F3R08]
MTERDELDMLVAEFVLGTLPASERDYVESRRREDPEVEALIQQWEERLGRLADEIEPVQPSTALFAKIEKALDRVESTPREVIETSSVVALRNQLNRWRWSTAIASAAALVLVAILALQPQPEPQTQSFVAVFQHNDQQPAFLLTVDLKEQRLNIRPVTAEPRPGKSYQLWIKADELGPNPRSVGVLGNDFALDEGALRSYDPALLKEATFGISVEPEGGSPTGQPTGPAIHGYLYPTDRNNQ